MSVLQTITGSLLSVLTGQILPAVLAVIGAMLGLSIAVYGLVKIYDYFRGSFKGATFIKIGHALGTAVRESEYRRYKSARDRSARQTTHRRRYDRSRN